MTANNKRDDWWKQAVVYQVYPRSFKDANGDGLGDIAGVTEKIPYLKALGVDAIWLSPFYPSDLADGGYDVIDYRNVDPRLGTMDDFDAMVAAAHEAGIKVIVDIVPNHTADKHVFFQEALAAGPGSPERDRYIFRDGRGEHGELPPNDWISLFGGPAWEQVPDGQWYLHIFAKQQPDVNWNNPDIHEEFKKTLRFWSDHGTDGFRIDVAHGLAKDLESTPLDQMDPLAVQHGLCHDFTSPLWDRREVHDIYREWREVFNEYNPPRFAVGEAWVVPEHQHLYASTDELGQVFNFEFAEANWDVDAMRAAILAGLRSAEETHDSTTTWVMSNHDVPRHVSRYGLPQVPASSHHQLAKDWLLRDGTSYFEDRELGTKRARAAILMELGLPGSVYIYQGEELGLPEVADIPWDRLEDPTPFFTRERFIEKGRDGCRVPLPWVAADVPAPAEWNAGFGTGASFGFSPAKKADGSASADPHLPQPLWYKDYAADAEAADDASMLNLYRATLTLRASLLTATADTADCAAIDAGHDVIAYSRPSTDGRRFASYTNFGAAALTLPAGEVVLASGDLTADGALPQDTTVWILLD
ncbi:alpha-amylase [Bifidobacterium sp. UTCIF-3]|uniref:glycoside hydrolase family 13 protein n=1 Tax=unclassified Bifidobacterium TaxID=2608897 RepID=UPI00112841C1|nr:MULTISPECIES: glycoside hydrolase family 13 protein [unclassified Bifidobacterium]TPF77873.1 alpha-amylase [Bifidobacterium sp. UTCIF-1]TPF81631.1 alpha-amylase [Bifidobacterium sp. UTCIF-3]